MERDCINNSYNVKHENELMQKTLSLDYSIVIMHPLSLYTALYRMYSSCNYTYIIDKGHMGLSVSHKPNIYHFNKEVLCLCILFNITFNIAQRTSI